MKEIIQIATPYVWSIIVIGAFTSTFSVYAMMACEKEKPKGLWKQFEHAFLYWTLVQEPWRLTRNGQLLRKIFLASFWGTFGLMIAWMYLSLVIKK